MHPGVLNGFAVLTAFLLMLGIAVYGIAERLAGPRLGALAALVTLTLPGTFAFSREYIFALPVAALLACAVYALLRSDGLRLRRWALACGFALGLMLLARTMTIAYMPGVAVAATLVILMRGPGDLPRRFLNLALLIVTSFAVRRHLVRPQPRLGRRLPHQLRIRHPEQVLRAGPRAGLLGAAALGCRTPDGRRSLPAAGDDPADRAGRPGGGGGQAPARARVPSRHREAAGQRRRRHGGDRVPWRLCGPNDLPERRQRLHPAAGNFPAAARGARPAQLPRRDRPGHRGGGRDRRRQPARQLKPLRRHLEPRLVEVPAFGELPWISGEPHAVGNVRQQAPGPRTRFTSEDEGYIAVDTEMAQTLLEEIAPRGVPRLVAFASRNRVVSTNSIGLAGVVNFREGIPFTQLLAEPDTGRPLRRTDHRP